MLIIFQIKMGETVFVQEDFEGDEEGEQEDGGNLMKITV